ncbi:MAG: phosphoenolpyruvate carboxykinase (ATP) [Gemmatimonadetes bacterium]|nr:phosphoenolpyruvate carboxykinase (ATP) [Gemmatimonadota bacterium]
MTGTTELARHGLRPRKDVHWNLAPAALVEAALCRGEGMLTADGAFVGLTAPHTGRSPNDKFVVREPSMEARIWWGPNQPLSEEHYAALKRDVLQYLAGEELFVRDVFAGADPEHRLSVRVVTTAAWQSLFVHNMFIEPSAEERKGFEPGFVVLHAPEMKADPTVHGTRTSTFIVLNFADRTVLIGGTRYAGEIKKSVFTVMNGLLPLAGVLPMHCSANAGEAGDTALFFGLSGTGKTTLSTDPSRHLIGDDEHGWSDRGIFNFEGGNYAKAIRLSAEGEPLIWAASHRFGAVLENVVMDPATRIVDWNSDAITENTRSSYPISFIEGRVVSGMGRHPSHVLFLTADAFGVLPPIARLTREQAMYHFLSGYTAKVAGTERGVTEPKATFSACFGAPFLPFHPSVYARMLGERIARHNSTVWLVNTGWTGGPAGVGHRMKLSYTRAMVHAALGGQLDHVPTRTDPIFRLEVPEHVPGVPPEVLVPRKTWADANAYDEAAQRLAGMFRENFQTFASEVSEAVRNAGP